KRLVKSRPAVSSTLASITWTKSLPSDMTSDEWRKLSELIHVLKPVKDITKFISLEKNVTIGFVLPLMHRLINNKMVRSVVDSHVTKTLKNAIRKDLRERWDLMQANIEDEIVLSAYLDPRFKAFDFVSTTAETDRLIQ